MTSSKNNKGLWVLGGLAAAMLAAVVAVWAAVIKQSREPEKRGPG